MAYILVHVFLYICPYKHFVMDTKLKLKLDPKIIEKAKKYASGKKLSLSRLIENYLNSLTSENDENEIQISSFVKSLSTDSKIPDDYNYKNFLDTNIIIDLLSERKPFYESAAKIASLAYRKQIILV